MDSLALDCHGLSCNINRAMKNCRTIITTGRPLDSIPRALGAEGLFKPDESHDKVPTSLNRTPYLSAWEIRPLKQPARG